MNWPIEVNDKFQGHHDFTIHKIIRWKIIRFLCIRQIFIAERMEMFL